MLEEVTRAVFRLCRRGPCPCATRFWKGEAGRAQGAAFALTEELLWHARAWCWKGSSGVSGAGALRMRSLQGPCGGSQEPGVGPASWLCPDQAGQRVSQAQHSRLSRRGAEAFLAGDQMRAIGVELSLQRAAH